MSVFVPVARISLENCARCGQPHASLNVWRFDRPVEHRGEIIATHWAYCPETVSPILVRFDPALADRKS